MAHSISLAAQWSRRTRDDGAAILERRFGAPRQADADQTVWLVGTAPGDGTLAVNDVELCTLAAGHAFEAEITALLQPRNTARMLLAADAATLDVRLEIRALV